MEKSWAPTPEQKKFIRRYSSAIESGDSAIFAGAGLSRQAGYIDWKTLLAEIADDLKLDIDRETDLIAIAQYHINEKKNRHRINQAIIDELEKGASTTESHKILARLPIPTVWTTNYDTLLEQAFQGVGKIIDVKIENEDFARNKRGRDVTIYKMHGCVSRAHGAVITKDDYEQYSSERRLFVESLKGDLISKTTLFLGYSFGDPNIDYILSRVRVLLGKHIHDHFCFMKAPDRPQKASGKQKAEYEYELTRTSLRQSDLLRFGIETVWINEFSDVERLLRALSSFVHRKSVFVSGSTFDYAPLGRDRIEKLSDEIGRRIIKDGYNLVSGFGRGIGEHCVLGVLRGLYGIPKGQDVDRILVRPFPSAKDGNKELQNQLHREELIARAGALIVMAGQRPPHLTPQVKSGVYSEVEIAQKTGKAVIPIGVTGHAAAELWKEAIKNPEKFLPGLKAKSELAVLGRTTAGLPPEN